MILSKFWIERFLLWKERVKVREFESILLELNLGLLSLVRREFFLVRIRFLFNRLRRKRGIEIFILFISIGLVMEFEIVLFCV